MEVLEKWYRRYYMESVKYIDWYCERAKGEKNIVKEGRSDYKYWKDLITETGYCISERDYKRIKKSGEELLEQYRKEKNLEAIEQLFYYSEGTEETDLFPDLPYFIGNTEKCARIRDYVCFRTALLYALKYESIRNQANLEEEKRNIRIQGLTWGFVVHSEESPELEWIEQLMNETQKTENDLLRQKVDLVKGGMVKIKQYYLETNKIPEIRGASILLDKINNKEMEKLIRQLHIRECLIYAGGGKMMGIFPEGSGEKICQKIELLVEKETITAQSNFCSYPYQIDRLIHNYNEIIDEVDLILEEHQGLRWDFRIEPRVELKIEKKKDGLEEKGYKMIQGEKKEFCTSCRNRYAFVENRNETIQEMLCQSCFYKRIEGGKSAKNHRFQEYQSYVFQKYKVKISISDPPFNKLEDIADENGFIGVIYGDANSMSNQINNLESFMMMRYFSEVTSDTVTNIVFDALFCHLKGKSSFEIIAVGGDDIFLIVPGRYAYDIACTIGELFDQRFQNQSIHKNNITMSIGVCITHHNMPVQYSFEIAQELLKSAKQKAWEERKKGSITGTIDWMVIENEMAGGANLEYLRRREPDKPEKTLRPYTWKQAKAVKKFLHQIEKEKSFAFQLRQSWYQHTKEEAELFYEYQISRKKEKSICDKFKIFAKEVGGEAVKNNIVYQKNVYSPWLDIVELWDYVEEIE